MFTFNYRINDIQEEVVISLMFKEIKVWSKTFDLSEFNEADFFDILYDDIIDEIISCDDDNQYQIYMKRENEIKKKLYDCLKEINKQINDTLHGDSKKNSSFVQSNYAYARYAIIKCFDKIKLGVKQLPKTINMIDMVEGNKCYAQIVFITTADKLDDYKTLEYEQIIGFKDITEKLFLCLGIKDIKKSNDTKNICYYYCKKNDKDTKTKIDYFSLKECEYIFSSNSSLKHELIPYLQYFYGQIDKLSLEKFSKNEINIDLYRKYYEQFIKLSKTDSVYILPFTNKLDKYKRIVLTIKDNEEKITKYFFENTDVAEIRNDEEKEYRDILLKQGVILPKNAILGSIDFVDFNKE